MNLPCQTWLQHYSRHTFSNDLLAGIIVCALLIPQGMAYALLAGMPAQFGLYAAMAPLVTYALLGSSRTLAVGPVAIVSLMTGTTLAGLNFTNQANYIDAAMHLSLLVALTLLALRLFKLGPMIDLLSQPVITGFTSAAALLIITSQLSHISAITSDQQLTFAHRLFQQISLWQNWNLISTLLAAAAIAILWLSKHPLQQLLNRISHYIALNNLLTKLGPLFVLVSATYFNSQLSSDSQLDFIGSIPMGLPTLNLFTPNIALCQQLWLPAVLIALIGFVESSSIATVLAQRHQQQIQSNQELLALGCANIAAAVSATFPVAGGLGRSLVNDSAGAKTPIASIISAVLLMVTISFFSTLFFYLPKASLAAIIIMAVIPLFEPKQWLQTWRSNRTDAVIMLSTFSAVLTIGVEAGLVSGLLLSIAVLLYRTSRPHIAIIGRVGEGPHFRNEQRHKVSLHSQILTIRIDESLCFANARHICEQLKFQADKYSQCCHLVLVCSAVNYIDTSAVSSLIQLIRQLRQNDIILHLAEVKGPVMDQLEHTSLLEELSPGQVFFTTDQAITYLQQQLN